MNKTVNLSFKQIIAILSFFVGTLIPSVYYFAQKRTEEKLSNVYLREKIEALDEKFSSDIQSLRLDFKQHVRAQNHDFGQILRALNEILVRSNREIGMEKKSD